MRALYLKIAAASVLCVQAAQAEVSINANQTKNMVCSDGVCAPTAKKAYLNVKDLQKLLKSSDIKVTTGAGAKTMGVDVPLTWTSTHRLTLDAIYRVEIKAPVTVAGTGALTIVYNDGGTGGDLLFVNNARIDFWDLGSSLVINGRSYALLNDIATLASAIANDPAASYALAKDYDAAADGTYRKPPIVTMFTGAFEGLGHRIDHLTVDGQVKLGDPHTGLFAWIDAGGLVRDIILRHAKVSSGSRWADAGLIAGENSGIIAHVIVSGAVTGTGDHAAVGGIAGWNAYNGTIEHSSAVAIKVLTGLYPDDAGGVAGLNVGVIAGAAATGTVSGGRFTGGLVGENDQGAHITQSYAAVTVAETDVALVGGLTGFNRGAVDNSYATGNVTGYFAGGFTTENDKKGTIVASYSNGLVTGQYEPAGFVSDQEAPDGSLADDYWDLDTSGFSDPGQGCGNIANCPGVTGLTDVQLKSALPAGFDPVVWGQNAAINNGYPYLLTNPPPQR